MKKVSIIIVNFNSSNYTIKAIESIYEFTHGVSYEIIVVDNKSKEEEILRLRDFCYDKQEIKLIESRENLGFGKANNLGAQKAIGEYLFFLNPDTILLNDAVSILYKHLKSNPLLGIIGGQLYDQDGSKMHSYSIYLPGLIRDIDTALSGLLSKIKLLNKNINSFEVGYITGADLMISKNLFNSINGFDPDFFMYYEESEMTYRIKKLGYKIECCPHAKIIHLEGKTHEFNEAKLRMIFTGRLLYMLKTKSRFKFKITDTCYKMLHQLKIIQSKLKKDDKEYQRIKNKMRIYNEIFQCYRK